MENKNTIIIPASQRWKKYNCTPVVINEIAQHNNWAVIQHTKRFRLLSGNIIKMKMTY